MDYPLDSFGAVPDGKTLNTAAIQAAIDACHAAGGGRVVGGPGRFLTGSVRLKDHVELHVSRGCRLIGSPNPDDYQRLTSPGFRDAHAPENTADYLIGAAHATDIAITGPGEIDASGTAFYDVSAGLAPNGKFACGKPARRPRLLILHACKDVRIEDATFADSPCWTCWLIGCERVGIHRLRIRGDRRLRNNDGIDLDGCREVTISDCHLQTEDDSIVVRAIQAVHDTPAICENITVSNCILDSTCQGIRIGCPSDHIVRNCLFSNLIIHSRLNGISLDFPAKYLKNGSDTRAEVSDLRFSNVQIDCGKRPFRISIQEGIALKRVSGIAFSGLRATGVAPCQIRGSTLTPIEDVSICDAHIAITDAPVLDCVHCRNIRFQNVEWNQLQKHA